jgi:hypothetical protein
VSVLVHQTDYTVQKLEDLRTKKILRNSYSTEQLQGQDYWDRIIGTGTRIRSVITSFTYTSSSNPNNGRSSLLIAHALNTSNQTAA